MTAVGLACRSCNRRTKVDVLSEKSTARLLQSWADCPEPLDEHLICFSNFFLGKKIGVLPFGCVAHPSILAISPSEAPSMLS